MIKNVKIWQGDKCKEYVMEGFEISERRSLKVIHREAVCEGLSLVLTLLEDRKARKLCQS
jgi:hypothetical protein